MCLRVYCQSCVTAPGVQQGKLYLADTEGISTETDYTALSVLQSQRATMHACKPLRCVTCETATADAQEMEQSCLQPYCPQTTGLHHSRDTHL